MQELSTVGVTRILLIEDSPSDARLFEAAVSDSVLHDAVVDVESTLEGGLSRMAAARYDAIVVDLGLPDSDGIDTFIAASQAAGDTPVIVISGLDDSRLAEKAILLGAQDYLIKATPRRGEIGRAIDFAVRRSSLLRALTRERQELVEQGQSIEQRVHDEMRPHVVAAAQCSHQLADLAAELSPAARAALSELMSHISELEHAVGISKIDA